METKKRQGFRGKQQRGRRGTSGRVQKATGQQGHNQGLDRTGSPRSGAGNLSSGHLPGASSQRGAMAGQETQRGERRRDTTGEKERENDAK